MNQSKPYFNADKAWVNLLGRFEGEGLVGQPISAAPRSSFMPLLKWAAAFVIIAATAAMIYLITAPNTPQSLTFANNVENQTLVKTLDDGSVVYLAGNSSVSFTNRFNNDNRSLKLEGEAFFEVASNIELPFIVEMGSSFVEAIGTSFGLKNLPGQNIELFVETGKVGFKTHQGKERVVVEKGEMLVFDGVELTKSASFFNSRWMKSHIHFSNEYLANIIGVINKNFAVNVKIEDQAIAQRQLTVTFNNNSVDEMVAIICEYYNLVAKNIDESTILLTMR